MLGGQVRGLSHM